MKKILVLGASGMLGSTVARWLAQVGGCNVTATTRTGAVPLTLTDVASINWAAMDADTVTPEGLAALFKAHDLVVNATGKIKQRMDETKWDDRVAAIRINALFPHLLAKTAEQTGTKVVQIATDCAFSGARGHYDETDAHDATDLYSRSKSMGECVGANAAYLRCSMIGPEVDAHFSLLSWFLSQPKGAKLQGYTNHLWNGVTSLHFAKLCKGLLEAPKPLAQVTHFVPADSVSKHELLKLFQDAFDRHDIDIQPASTPTAVDRTLATTFADINVELWKAAGYATPPSIKDMVLELSAYVKQSR